jgi:hypothetical protein
MASKIKKLDKYSDLQGILQTELQLNAARTKFLTLLLVSMLKVQSVNLERFAQGFENQVDLASNLRRIQRFFAFFALPEDGIARLLYKLLPVKGRLKLSLDRTNWKFGSWNINILVLGVIYKGVAIPLLWSFLGNKRGNSSQRQRIALLSRYIRLFGSESIEWLTADRAFIGKIWFSFLIQKEILFFIRIRNNMNAQVHNSKIKVCNLFFFLELNEAFDYPIVVDINGCSLYLSGLNDTNDRKKRDLLIVASWVPTKQALLNYQCRWQIETMFRAFQSAGFQLEQTHLIDSQRLNRVLMLVAIAFVWAYKVGIYQHTQVKAIPIKKHGRRAQSFFSAGFELLSQAHLNFFATKIALFVTILIMVMDE